MAGDLTDFLEGKILDQLFNKGAYASWTALYVALSTTTPDEDGTNFTEPASNYGRVYTYTADWTRDGSIIDNNDEIAFVEATGSWGTITHVGLFDAVISGNLLAFKSITSKAITTDDTARFKLGDLDFSMD